MNQCPKCGNINVSENAAFCPKCGCKMKSASTNKKTLVAFSNKKQQRMVTIVCILLIVGVCLTGAYKIAVNACEKEIYDSFEKADAAFKSEIEDSLYTLIYDDFGFEENAKMNSLIDKNVNSAIDACNAGRSMEISNLKLGFSQCSVEVRASNASLDSGIASIISNCISGSTRLTDILGGLWDAYTSSEDSYEFVDSLFDNLWTAVEENRKNAPKISADEKIILKRVDGEWKIVSEDALQRVTNAYGGISDFDQKVIDTYDGKADCPPSDDYDEYDEEDDYEWY